MVHKNRNDHFIIIAGVSEHKFKACVNIISQDVSNLAYLHYSNCTDPFRNKLNSLDIISQKVKNLSKGYTIEINVVIL